MASGAGKKKTPAGRRKARPRGGAKRPSDGARKVRSRAAARTRSGVRVVFVSSECAPFAKTGGLADVAASLPAVLAEQGADVTVVLPLYRSVRESGLDLAPLDPPAVNVPVGPHVVEVGLEGAPLAGGRVRLVCLRYDPYFDRRDFYGEDSRDYPDNAMRFSLFARGAIAASRALGISPHIYHANDWQAALVCAYVKTVESGSAGGARSLLTIHNIGYQGRFWKWDLPWTGLDWSLFNPDSVEFYDMVNFLKAGVVFADAVNTVSPTYAREIQSSAEYGMGLEGALRRRAAVVFGILNGIDTSEWNPETDAHVPANYSVRDLTGKAACKAELQRELRLPGKADAPILASIGRLAEQKGTSLILEIADDLLALEPGCQLVVLGEGDARLESALRRLEARRPENVRVRIGYDDRLAHRIEAGGDVLLMPSLYEPCGLSQLYGMTYGTIPVVRRTGGLADTVEDSTDEDAGTGFVFDAFRPEAFLEAAGRAIARYRRPAAWRALVARAMRRDWSWERSGSEYAALYEKILAR